MWVGRVCHYVLLGFWLDPRTMTTLGFDDNWDSWAILMYDCGAAPLRDTGEWGTPDRCLPRVKMENFPLAAFFFFPWFQNWSGAIDLNLGFSDTEDWSGYLGKCYQNTGSSESALRDTEKPIKAAVNSTVFKEDQQELGCYWSSWEQPAQVRVWVLFWKLSTLKI